MKISRHDKALLFEQEILTLLLIIVLGFVFHTLRLNPYFYLITLAIGFILYFWMIYEEDVHRTGKKHDYFEHTSSFIMIAQTALALELLSLKFNFDFLVYMFLAIGVIMYSVSLSRIILLKAVFNRERMS